MGIAKLLAECEARHREVDPGETELTVQGKPLILILLEQGQDRHVDGLIPMLPYVNLPYLGLVEPQHGTML
jgi:hypothetical protein